MRGSRVDNGYASRYSNMSNTYMKECLYTESGNNESRDNRSENNRDETIELRIIKDGTIGTEDNGNRTITRNRVRLESAGIGSGPEVLYGCDSDVTRLVVCRKSPEVLPEVLPEIVSKSRGCYGT